MAPPRRSKPPGKSDLGDRIWWAREAAGITSQDELATRAGISRERVVKVEAGTSKGRSLELMTALARGFSRPLPNLTAYLDGAFGPVGQVAAERFVGGEEPETPMATPELSASMRAVLEAAVGRLTMKSPKQATLIGSAANSLAFHKGEKLTVEQVAKILTTKVRDAGKREKS